MDWRPYNALSYVWGSQPFSETISCNGNPLNITPSLSDTLRELFLYSEGLSSKRPIWIDAICLNQQNRTELEVQVPLMYNIYSKASLVLVYLGKAEDNSDLAMDAAYIADLRDRLHAIDDPSIQFSVATHVERLPSVGIEGSEHPIWYAF
jgi:hypothetical protein